MAFVASSAAAADTPARARASGTRPRPMLQAESPGCPCPPPGGRCAPTLQAERRAPEPAGAAGYTEAREAPPQGGGGNDS